MVVNPASSIAQRDGDCLPPACEPIGRRGFLLRSMAWVGAASLPAWTMAQTAPPSLLLMAGAGYKRPIEAICHAFTRSTGIAVERSYGNLQQVFAQARASGRVDVLVGDTAFIDKAKELALPQRLLLGQGVMVLAGRRGLTPPAGPDGHSQAQAWLQQPGLSVAMPNPQQAIYGHAAQQWLQAQGRWEAEQARLKIVGTVPQVAAYLTSGQVDLGFINLTEAMALQAQLGGVVRVPAGADSYRQIDIVAALPAATDALAMQPAREAFVQFLQSPTAQSLLRQAGL